MSIDRSTIIRGPAIVGFNSQMFYSKDDIVVSPQVKRFQVESSMYGKVDERLDDISFEISFTPAGEWEAISTLFPYASADIGASVFGAVDKNLTIQTKAGKLITFYACAVTKMPSLSLSANKTAFGPVTFTAIGANNTAWSSAAKRVAIADQAFSDTTFSPTAIKTVPFSAAWGLVAPWSAFVSQDGFNVDFNISLEPVSVDSDGTVDMTLGSVEATCRCVPVGITEAQLMALLSVQGGSVARGISLSSAANDLVLTGSGASLTLYNAAPVAAGMRFGNKALRAGEVEFVTCRKFTTGAAQACFAIS